MKVYCINDCVLNKFKEGEIYEYTIRSNSIGVLNKEHKTWYNYFRYGHHDYNPLLDFDLYFEDLRDKNLKQLV